MKTVYVGLSGGVDSSVAAALLMEQGFKVVGVYMKNWTQDVGGVRCPLAADLADARRAAAVLEIPFKVFDFQDAYKQHVVDVMVAEYAAGRTPNPDVLCNQDIKFRLFLEAALEDGADLIATGHYARVDGGRLLAGADSAKDQSYFLYRVTPEALARTMFPVGGLTKPQVRELARKFRLPTAEKPDSQGICFVGEVGIRAFLRQYITPQPGPIVDTQGRELGRHEGAIFYTIGQRQGLGIGGGGPYYVCAKDMPTNTVVVTTDVDDLLLQARLFRLGDVHWILDAPQNDERCAVRIRHRGERLPGRLLHGDDGWSVALERQAKALAVGQAAVVYRGEEVLGGGSIEAPARVVL